MKRHAHPQRNYFFETLEYRALMTASPAPAATNLSTLIYSIDGSGNNLANPEWGAAGQDLYRGIIAPNYGDGISSLNNLLATGGGTLPSARLISNVLGNQTGDILDNRDLSAFIYAWGQFIDHDLDLTPDGGASVPIAVPTGDPQFDPGSTGTQTLPFTRSITDPTTGTSAANPLNQPTVVTSFIDGSQIYGSDATTAAALRTFSGGMLKTSVGNLLPIGIVSTMADQGPYPASDMFSAGDVPHQ